MNIIAQNGGIVNIFAATSPAAPAWVSESRAGKTAARWTEKKQDARRMAEKLRKIGEFRRADRMTQCAEILSGERCVECGHIHISRTQLCRDRVCPVCTWRLSMKRFSNMAQIMDALRNAYPGAHWQFVTLTAKNCTPASLGATIDEMSRAWNCIASRKTFKRSIVGWARALEITYNAKSRTLHPHYHMLLMWREGATPSETYLTGEWCAATHLVTSPKAQNSQMIRPRADTWNSTEDPITDAVLETYKYSVKSSDLQEMPLSVFRAAVEALKGRRLVAFGGMVKDYARMMQLEDMDTPDEDDDQTPESLSRCTKCDGEVIRISAEWAGTGYIWRDSHG